MYLWGKRHKNKFGKFRSITYGLSAIFFVERGQRSRQDVERRRQCHTECQQSLRTSRPFFPFGVQRKPYTPPSAQGASCSLARIREV